MFRIETATVTLETGMYIKEYRFPEEIRGYCRDCGNYGNIWTCPPYGYEPLCKFADRKYVILICRRVWVDDVVRDTGSQDLMRDESYRIMARLREITDPLLLGHEINHPGSIVLFAGCCTLCDKCSRVAGAPCRYPDKARPSLEAYGFDIARTVKGLFGIELKWGKGNVLPEYFTFVSAVFTDHQINIEL